jgi:rare lipoprotein A
MCPPIVARRQAGGGAATVALVAAALTLAGCAGGPAPPTLRPGLVAGGRTLAYNRPYQVRGRWYVPHAQPGYDVTGVASWYSYEAPSRRTADGEPFDIRLASAAHTTLPIPSWLEVTNLDNGRRARVRLNDRGPFVSGRVLDVSRAAAVELGFVAQGTAHVRVRYLGPASPIGGGEVWAAASRTEARSPDVLLADSSDVHRHGATATLASPPPPDPRAEVVSDSVALDPGEGGAASDDPDPRTTPPSPLGAGARFEVQVAAFADRGNAERAVARLTLAGQPRIEPLRRGDVVLYRVLVGTWPQAQDAAVARGQAVALGFSDARVIAR